MTGSPATAVTAALRELESSSVLVSRLASPDLRDVLPGVDVREVPAVGGRAVWPPDSSAVSIAEWPGWLGQTERPPPSPSICITAAGAKPEWISTALIAAGPSGYTRVGPDWVAHPDAAADYAQRSSGTRRVVAHLTQARGVLAAWPVHSPRALLLLPRNPGPAVAACPPPSGLAVAALAGFPEFPGGLRIHMQNFVDQSDLRSWATEFTATVISGEQAT